MFIRRRAKQLPLATEENVLGCCVVKCQLLHGSRGLKPSNGKSNTREHIPSRGLWLNSSSLSFFPRLSSHDQSSIFRSDCYLLGIIYTDAVSNRHGFMTLKPHRKQHGFEAFTRNRYNRSRNGDLVPRRSRFVKDVRAKFSTR